MKCVWIYLVLGAAALVMAQGAEPGELVSDPTGAPAWLRLEPPSLLNVSLLTGLTKR